MSEIWFTSDTHFTHGNLMKHYPDRARFKDEDEMKEWMIQEWNKRIQPKDTVYHIGDFGGKDADKDLKVARRLKGRLFYVPGNHDRKIVKLRGFQERCSMLYPYSYAEISIDKQKIVLCHFPIWEWNQIHREAWHIHGHVHAKPTGIPGKIMDAGVDGNGLVPYHFEDVRRHMNKRPVRFHHANEDDQ